MWIFILIAIIVLFVIYVSNRNKKTGGTAQGRHERQFRETAYPPNNNNVSSQYKKTQTSSKKKYNIPPAE